MEITTDFLERVNLIINEISLDKDINWEIFKFDKIKKLAIIKSAEAYLAIEEQTDIAREDKTLSLIAIMSYLIIENTYFRLTNDLYSRKASSK